MEAFRLPIFDQFHQIIDSGNEKCYFNILVKAMKKLAYFLFDSYYFCLRWIDSVLVFATHSLNFIIF